MAKQERLSNEEFLTRLTELLKAQSSHTTGSITLTQKRLSPQSDSSASSSPVSTAPFTDLQPPQPLPVLIRATNGKSEDKRSSSAKIVKRKHDEPKIKLATVVQPEDLEGFFVRYGEVWRKEMGGLKKRDRKKKKKEKKGGEGIKST